jgi:hypothetical protein
MYRKFSEKENDSRGDYRERCIFLRKILNNSIKSIYASSAAKQLINSPVASKCSAHPSAAIVLRCGKKTCYSIDDQLLSAYPFATVNNCTTAIHFHALEHFIIGSQENDMVINDWIHVVAGSLILLSLTLGVDIPANPLFVSRYWLLFTTFVGINLLQFGITQFCPLGVILKKLGVPEH